MRSFVKLTQDELIIVSGGEKSLAKDVAAFISAILIPIGNLYFSLYLAHRLGFLHGIQPEIGKSQIVGTSKID